MRKIVKQEIKDLLNTLREANEEIVRLFSLQDFDSLQAFLVDCQQAAIEIGNTIEENEGVGTETVCKLEEYCECLYQILENGSFDLEKMYQLFDEIDYQINLFPYKKEIVFFPYKASMWDSLESIYLAAKEDPNCDAYCVPIPYFDKNPDGSLAEMHYEGKEYPDNIEITDYRKYNFEERRPDVIYIHNPYDEWNYVTTVHPRFYAKNLSNYTEQLVYVPYFVLQEIEPDNQLAIDCMKHFIWTPGVIYSDKVILQSEKMKEIYINELVKENEEKELNNPQFERAYLEKKILGTGSPKFDKLLRTKKEDIEIPDEWMRVILKEDGSWKKIVFYNTTVAALLQYEGQWINKIEDVLSVFEKNKDEICLLWRPHPLVESTLQSMKPQLMERYNRIKEKYIQGRWGIYDDTSDLDRAIILSDVYYGDLSSIVNLYKEIEKVCIIQNQHCLTNIYIPIAIENVVYYQNQFWAYNQVDSSIVKFDIDTFNVEIEVMIPWEEGREEYHELYGEIILYHGKLLLVPVSASKICIYDIKKQETRYIDFNENNIGKNGRLFGGVVQKDRYSYLVPCKYNYMLKVDMELETAYSLGEKLYESFEEKSQIFSFASILEECDDIFFTSITFNNIYRFNIQREVYDIYFCSELEKGGIGIIGDENGIWIIPRRADKILFFDKRLKKMKKYDDFPNGYVSGDWSFYRICQNKKFIIFMPRTANMCLVLNKFNGEIQNILPFDLKERENKGYFEKYKPFSCLDVENNNFLFLSNFKNEITKINIDTKETVNCMWNINYNLDRCKFAKNKYQIIYEKESGLMSLENIINTII